MTASEPLIGDELIRITLETYSVSLVFAANALDIGCGFTLRSGADAKRQYDPGHHAGDMRSLWDCIGSKVSEVDWKGEIRIIFSNGTELIIPRTPGQSRGTLRGTVMANGRPLPGYDDF